MKRASMILIALLALPAFAADSPLVQAAKRTNRAKPKAAVITNESVKASTGRITTTSALTPLQAPAAQPAAAPQKPYAAPRGNATTSTPDKEKEYEKARQPRPVT